MQLRMNGIRCWYFISFVHTDRTHLNMSFLCLVVLTVFALAKVSLLDFNAIFNVVKRIFVLWRHLSVDFHQYEFIFSHALYQVQALPKGSSAVSLKPRVILLASLLLFLM